MFSTSPFEKGLNKVIEIQMFYAVWNGELEWLSTEPIHMVTIKMVVREPTYKQWWLDFQGYCMTSWFGMLSSAPPVPLLFTQIRSTGHGPVRCRTGEQRTARCLLPWRKKRASNYKTPPQNLRWIYNNPHKFNIIDTNNHHIHFWNHHSQGPWFWVPPAVSWLGGCTPKMAGKCPLRRSNPVQWIGGGIGRDVDRTSQRTLRGNSYVSPKNTPEI